jgi:hypothetical protein
VKTLAKPFFFSDDIENDKNFDLKVQNLDWSRISEAVMLPRIARGIRLCLFYS